jgi:hypothetical protein
MSGWFLTAWFDSVVNILQLRAASAKAHINVSDVIVQGDDITCTVEKREHASRLLDTLTSFGLIINKDKTLIARDRFDWLKATFRTDGCHMLFARTISGTIFQKPWNGAGDMDAIMAMEISKLEDLSILQQFMSRLGALPTALKEPIADMLNRTTSLPRIECLEYLETPRCLGGAGFGITGRIKIVTTTKGLTYFTQKAKTGQTPFDLMKEILHDQVSLVPRSVVYRSLRVDEPKDLGHLNLRSEKSMVGYSALQVLSPEVTKAIMAYYKRQHDNVRFVQTKLTELRKLLKPWNDVVDFKCKTWMQLHYLAGTIDVSVPYTMDYNVMPFMKQQLITMLGIEVFRYASTTRAIEYDLPWSMFKHYTQFDIAQLYYGSNHVIYSQA